MSSCLQLLVCVAVVAVVAVALTSFSQSVTEDNASVATMTCENFDPAARLR